MARSITFIEQASLPAILLPACDEAQEDELAGDPDTDSVNVGVLTATSHGYTRVGPPRCILGLHPGNVLQDILVGENPTMAQTFGNQFLKVHGN